MIERKRWCGVGVCVYGVDFVAARAQSSGGSEGAASRRHWPAGWHLTPPAALTVAIGARAGGSTSRIWWIRRGGVSGAGHRDAQQLLGRYGKLDRIDVTVAASEISHGERQARRTAGRISGGETGRTQPGDQRMVRAFRWNLRVLATFASGRRVPHLQQDFGERVRRRRDRDTTRRGREPRDGVRAVLVEALLLGAVGSMVGVRWARAGGRDRGLTRSVNALYTSSRPRRWNDGERGVVGILTGVIVAFVSALKPAREASRWLPPGR